MNTTTRKKTQVLVECAIMIALATVLSLIKVYEAPLGGSVTLLSMFPIMLISFRHGLKWGFASAFVYSLTQLFLGMSVLTYVPTPIGVFATIMLDYILPFTLIGIAGIFSYGKDLSKGKLVFAVVGGVLLAVLLRFGCHILSGGLIWYEITKAGEWNTTVFEHGMWAYSFIYNFAYMGPEGAIHLIASPLIIKLKDLLK